LVNYFKHCFRARQRSWKVYTSEGDSFKDDQNHYRLVAYTFYRLALLIFRSHTNWDTCDHPHWPKQYKLELACTEPHNSRSMYAVFQEQDTSDPKTIWTTHSIFLYRTSNIQPLLQNDNKLLIWFYCLWSNWMELNGFLITLFGLTLTTIYKSKLPMWKKNDSMPGFKASRNHKHKYENYTPVLINQVTLFPRTSLTEVNAPSSFHKIV
jgi:hypothetical protein